MLIPRGIIASSLTITLLTFASLLIPDACTHAQAQAPSATISEDTAQGIELYRQGDMNRAIATLRAVVKKNPEDLIAWEHLVLALQSKGKKYEARKALEKVAELRLKLFQKEFDAVCEQISDANISGLELLHQGAFNIVDTYLAASSRDEVRNWWSAFNVLIVQGEFLKLAREALAQGKTLRWSEVPREKVHVLMKPEPAFTEEARRNHLTGKVVLKAILAADGKIKEIRVLRELRFGLTEVAVEAAHKIRFRPATIGGRPVSQHWHIEYNFN